MPDRSIQVFPEPQSLAISAARTIAEIAGDAIARRDRFSIALAGGHTPEPLYEFLASDEFSRKVDWEKWEIFFTDERCVPPVHPDSNFRMASKLLLDQVPLKPENIHRMKGEIEPETAAKEYGQLLRDKFGEFGPDVILLGLGPDGHTASLFPGSTAVAETHHRCVANFAPAHDAWRITMTASFINRAGTVIVMATGIGKAKITEEVLQSDPNTASHPIQLIAPSSGKLLWLMDAGAAGMADEE